MNDNWKQTDRSWITHEFAEKGANLQVNINDDDIAWSTNLQDSAMGGASYASGRTDHVEDAKANCEVARRLLVALQWLGGARGIHPDEETEVAEILEPLFAAVHSSRKYDGA